MLKNIHEAWQDGFSGQRSLLTSLIDPVDKCGGRRERILAICPLTMHTTHVYKYRNKIFKKKRQLWAGSRSQGSGLSGTWVLLSNFHSSLGGHLSLWPTLSEVARGNSTWESWSYFAKATGFMGERDEGRGSQHLQECVQPWWAETLYGLRALL